MLLPSYEELVALVVALRSELASAHAEIAELKRQLGQTSRNSSKPPSSDGLAKPAPKSLRGKSGRKPGGQIGHPGATLRQVAVPDAEVPHEPQACAGCGENLAGRPVTAIERRQEYDLPPISVKVTEHQLIERECSCGVRTRADAPVGIDAPVQYGPRISAIIVYLYVGQFLSKKRTAEALAELFGTPVSPGTVTAITGRAAGGLDDFCDVVRGRLIDSAVVGFDETGLRVAGKLHWVHCARTDKYTLLTCHPKRGTAGIDDLGVLGRFGGVAVHDAWAPYDTYADVEHQLCCAHALRELAAVAEATPADTDWCWATQAADALVAMQKQVTETIDTGILDEAALTEQVQLYRSAAQIGITQNAARSSTVMKKHHALARRLINRQDDYLRFTHDWRVPPDNNGSERDIRMIKLRQKISGCLRTLLGAQQFCTIRSYLSTAAKHGHPMLNALTMLTEHRPWLPAIQ